jgi:hypothetical protein
MTFVYLPFLAVLLWTYWCALKRVRDERTPLTPIMGWLVGLGYFVMAPLTILIVHGGYRIPDVYEANELYASVDLSNSKYVIPMLVIGLALFLAFQAILVLKPKKDLTRRASYPSLNKGKLKRIVFLTFGFAMVDYVFSVWRAGGLESFLISHWYLRQVESFASFGDLFVLYTQFSLANQVVFTAVAALYTARQLQRHELEWRFSGFLGFALILQMVMSGNRIFIALYGLSFLTACWLYRRKKLIYALLLLSPAVLLLFSAWAYVRHDLSAITDSVPSYIEREMDGRVMATLMDATEGSSVMQLLHMINDFGDKFSFFYGATYSKAVTFMVPRQLYPNKPENFPVQIAQLYEPGGVTSLSTTQLGELYANFGVFTILMLPTFTISILFLSAKLTPKMESHALLLAVLFLLMVSFARTSFEDNFITFVFTSLLMWGLRLQRGLYCTGGVAPLRQLAQT